MENPMKIKSLFFFLILFSPSAYAQYELFNNPVDHGLGRTGAVTVNSWSHFSNPSGIADMTELVAGIGYNNLFGVKELDSKAAICIIPTKLIIIGAGYVYYGFEDYNSQIINLSVAKNLAPWCKMGMRFNYMSRRQIHSESLFLFTLDAGLQLKPAENVGIGFYAVNPMALKWELPNWEEYQSSYISAALLYEPAKQLLIEVGLVKNIKTPTEMSFSINVPIHEQVVLRSGMMTNPIRLGFGGGFKWKPVTIDLAFNHHSVLGFSTSVGLLFSIKQMKQKKS